MTGEAYRVEPERSAMSSHDQEPGIHQTTYKQPAGKVPTEATKATKVHAETVEGETVILEQSSAGQISGDRVTASMSKISSVQAGSVQMEKCAAVNVTSDRASLQECASVWTNAESVRMVKSTSFLMSSNETTMEEGSTALLVITGGLTGEARALVTVPASALLGALLAVVGTVVFALTQGSRKR